MRARPPTLLQTLSQTSLFEMLDEAQLSAIAEHTSILRLGRECGVIDEGDIATGTFWVVYGQVKVGVHCKDGGSRVLAILGAGKCFGMGEMLHEQPHLAFVRTTTDSMLLHTERTVMLDIARKNFAFAQELLRCMGRQYYTLLRDLGASAQSARQRLASYLLRHAPPEPGAPIELEASKNLIASRLNVTPETMSRLLREFTFEGLIQVAGRRINVLDWQRVAAVA